MFQSAEHHSPSAACCIFLQLVSVGLFWHVLYFVVTSGDIAVAGHSECQWWNIHVVVNSNDIALWYLFVVQHKVTCVAQYELISRTSGDAGDSIVDRHGSIDATVEWSRHSALLQEPPLDVIATLVTKLCLGNSDLLGSALHDKSTLSQSNWIKLW